MRKTEFAFLSSVSRLFSECPKLYLWTFTMRKGMPDWWYARVWAEFVRKLGDLYGGQLRGVKVVELHATHGLHWHVLLNQRVWVGEVRRIGGRLGIGVVHVVRADEASAGYLAKYIGKDLDGQGQRGPLRGGVCRWGTVGGFRGCRVKDVVVDSPFHRKMEEAKKWFPTGKVPWPLASAIFQRPQADGAAVRQACARYVRTGSTTMLWATNPARYGVETEARNHRAMAR